MNNANLCAPVCGLMHYHFDGSGSNGEPLNPMDVHDVFPEKTRANWEKIRYHVIPMYHYVPTCTPDPSDSLAVASCCAFSCLSRIGREEKKRDSFFGQAGFSRSDFNGIHQESLIPLSFWPMMRKIQVPSALGKPLLLSCLVLLPAHLVQANGHLILEWL